MSAVVAAPAGYRAVRAAGRRRGAAALVLLLVAVVTVALAVGDYSLSPLGVWRALVGGGSRIDGYVVWQVRLPRVAMAALCGAALGLSGAVFQTLLRNPLASPDLLGVSGGASVGAVAASLLAGWTGAAVAGSAFVGAAVVAVVLLAAARRLADGGYRLVLAGVGIAFLCTAIVGYLLKRAQREQAASVLVWITGGLGATTWDQIAVMAAAVLLVVPAVVALARLLPVLELGDAAATGLGAWPVAIRAVAVVTAVLLAAVTTSFIGPVAFVALGAPAIARSLAGRGAVALGQAGLTGAVLLLCADLAAQHAVPGVSVPAGVVTGAVGAPYLLWLLATSKGRRG